MDNESEKSINFKNINSKQNCMANFYRTRQEAESHRTRRGERIYYKAGYGWYIIRPKYREDTSGNIWYFST